MHLQHTSQSPTASALQRLEILHLAQKLGNVSEACQLMGVDRSSFYKWQRRYLKGGMAGLEDQSRRRHTGRTAEKVEASELIRGIALANPLYGCDRIAAVLEGTKWHLTAMTVQRILNGFGLRDIDQRRRASKLAHPHMNFDAASIEGHVFEDVRQKINVSRPGEYLYICYYATGIRVGGRNAYLLVIIDLFSFYSFATVMLRPAMTPVVNLIEQSVLPFFHKKQHHVDAVVMPANAPSISCSDGPLTALLERNNIRVLTLYSPLPGLFSRIGGLIYVDFATMAGSVAPNIELDACEALIKKWTRRYNSGGFKQLSAFFDPPVKRISAARRRLGSKARVQYDMHIATKREVAIIVEDIELAHKGSASEFNQIWDEMHVRSEALVSQDPAVLSLHQCDRDV